MLKSWNEYVRDDLAAIGHAYDWWRKCKDREQWKTIAQGLLDVPSPQDWKRCNKNINSTERTTASSVQTLLQECWCWTLNASK